MAGSMNGALALAGGAVAITLYNRGVFQSAWNALKGPSTPLIGQNLGNVSVDTSTWGGGGTTPPGTLPPSSTIDPAALAAAEAATTATKGPRGWLNWCLQWVDDTRQRLGLKTSTGPGGRAANATAACSQQTLHPGIAPLGASVCFRDAPGSGLTDGHIGIANANGTYTSAGITDSITTGVYVNNPYYTGWFQ